MSFGGSSYGDAELGSTTTTTQEIAVPETQLTQTSEDLNLNPGNSSIQVTPPTQLNTDNPDIQLTPGTSTITIPETKFTQTTPAFEIEVGLFIRPEPTQLNQSTPELELQPGDSPILVPETQLTASNPEFGLNRQIVVGVATNLESENPDPEVQSGAVSVTVPETSVLSSNPAVQVQPGETKIQTELPSELENVNPEFNIVPGAAELQVSETQLTASIEEPSIRLILEFTSPTNALITNDERFFDMPDHTFTEGDLGDTLQAVLKDDSNPDGVDLLGASQVKLVVKDRDGVKVFDKEMNIVDSSNGKVEYKWDQGDFIEDPGVYRSKIKVFDFSDSPESFPNDGFRTIEIEEEIS